MKTVLDRRRTVVTIWYIASIRYIQLIIKGLGDTCGFVMDYSVVKMILEHGYNVFTTE